tara:strand:- start:124 stop:255 length:132 start_codon:yes stop_codon:yes gene_type:complete
MDPDLDDFFVDLSFFLSDFFVDLSFFLSDFLFGFFSDVDALLE